MTSNSPSQSHELHTLSPPSPTHQDDKNTQRRNNRHTFKPASSPLSRERDHQETTTAASSASHAGKKIPFGHRMMKKEIGWWERNIARVLPVGDDVRDHFGEFIVIAITLLSVQRRFRYLMFVMFAVGLSIRCQDRDGL